MGLGLEILWGLRMFWDKDDGLKYVKDILVNGFVKGMVILDLLKRNLSSVFNQQVYQFFFNLIDLIGSILT